MRLLTLWFALLACSLAWLSGCAKKSDSAYSSYPSPSYDESYGGAYGGDSHEEAEYDDYAYNEAPVSATASVEGSRSRSILDSIPQGRSYSSETAAPPPPPPPQEASARAEADPPPPEEVKPEAKARKVHYNGFANLLTTDPEETVAQVVALAEERGGFVERRSLQDVTVRVPVDSFQDTFDDVLAMGDVLNKSLTAQDVTEAFQSAELRLGTARTTRARLQELLAQAKTEEEKLMLLREIQRLTEEIDVMESQLRTLSRLADFSRLTVKATPRQAYVGVNNRPEVAGFGWIRSLSPFRRDVAQSGKPLKLDAPAGLVELDLKRHFVAESADGTVVWSGRLLNDPEGDTDFWTAAITDRLSDEFTAVTTEDIGGYTVTRMLEPGADDPYRYLIAVRADGRWLELVEIYYPNTEQEDRYRDALRAMLTGSPS